MLEIAVSDRSCDLPDACSRITEYCSNNQIPPKMGYRIQLIFEELVQQILLPVMPDPDLLFTVEYSGVDESVAITVNYGGEPYDPEKTENSLSLRMLRGAVSDMRCETTEHTTRQNRIVIRVMQ